jgi:hypothetical protein
MDCLRHFAPAVDLRLGVDARRPGIALAARFDLRAFADHETRAGTLPVIAGHEVGRQVAGLAAALARERWQYDAVLQCVAPQRHGHEQRWMLHGMLL